MSKYVKWSESEIDYLKQNIGATSIKGVATHLGRTVSAVHDKLHKLGLKTGRNWTAEEVAYLQDSWGMVAIPGIAKKLNRSVNAIKIKAFKEGLGAHLDSSDRVSLNQLLVAFDKSGSRGSGYFIGQLERAGCPIKYHRVDKNRFRVIDMGAFWKWAEPNKNLFDWAKLEPGILGPEPEWAKEKRRIDQQNNIRPHNTPWTGGDDNALKTMLAQYRYTYRDLSKYFGRSESAIKRRIHDLKIKHRPLRAAPRSWQEDEVRMLLDMHKRGFSYEQIADKMDRTALQVRGKHENMVHPEWQADIRKRKKEDKQKKKLVRKLLYLLKLHRNSMEFGEYWQKDMCMLWDDLDGCTAGESNCDECVSLQRIKPQYCRRCGAQVMSRKEIDICERCKKIRKWQHRKKVDTVDKIRGREKQAI